MNTFIETQAAPTTLSSEVVGARVARLDWPALRQSLHTAGYAMLPTLLSPAECGALIRLYDEAELFRARVDMQAHAFGRGEYKYFRYPLPDDIAQLRAHFYRELVPVANAWNETLADDRRFPRQLPAFLAECRAHKQLRPTPLILKYGVGDFNCLHQDVYGPVAFPLQVVLVLNQRGRDFEGGDFVLTERRPRRQAKVQVLSPLQGAGIVFPGATRPVAGKSAPLRARLHHGLSPLSEGSRYALGLVFHDAL